MDSLIAVGSGASVVYGLFAFGMIVYGTEAGDWETVHRYLHDLYFESAAMIVTLVTLGKTLESNAREKASSAVRDLAGMIPDTAEKILPDGTVETVATSLFVLSYRMLRCRLIFFAPAFSEAFIVYFLPFFKVSV